MKRNNISVLSLIYLFPILDIFLFLGKNTISIYIIKGIIAILFIIKIIIEKKNIPYLMAVLGLPLLIILYTISKTFPLLEPTIFVINITILPLLMLMNKEKNASEKRLWLLFWEYLIIFTIALITNYNINEYSLGTITILSISIPWILKDLITHHNLLTKYLGIALIILFAYVSKSIIFTIISIITLCYYLWNYISKKDKKESIICGVLLFILLLVCIILSGLKNDSSWIDNTYNERITEIHSGYNSFTNTNIDEMLFGTIALKDNIQHIDGVEIFYNIGYVGTIYYIILILISIIKTRHQKNFYLPWILLIIISTITGHALTNSSLAIIMFLIITKKETNKKKILLVSNMYPSKKYKHYGSFVKNMVLSLNANGYEVDVEKIYKHRLKLIKPFSYALLYTRVLIKSFIFSYDYFYSHFISHSTFPLIPARITSLDTILIGNAHGNDIVVDNNKDEKNIKRSKIALKYIDRLVVPSLYYKELVKKEYNIKDNNIVVYPSGGVDFTIFTNMDKQECQKELGLEENFTYYGFVSRIEKDKGWDTLLDALNILNQENKLNKTKVIIIGDGEELPLLKQKIKEYELDDIIIQKSFVYQKELVKYYNAFDLLIFPTKRKSESLGLVGLEAMACLTPTIICTLYGPRSYANNNNSLIYTKTANGEELASKITEFNKLNEAEKERLINNAYITSKEYASTSLEESLNNIFNKGE